MTADRTPPTDTERARAGDPTAHRELVNGEMTAVDAEAVEASRAHIDDLEGHSRQAANRIGMGTHRPDVPSDDGGEAETASSDFAKGDEGDSARP